MNSLSHFIKRCSSELDLWTGHTQSLGRYVPAISPSREHKAPGCENVIKVLSILKKSYCYDLEKLDLMCKFE